MFEFKFSCKSSNISRFTKIFTGISLVLTFLGQINTINYIGAMYVIATILLGKIDQIKYGLSISLTGCVYDFFYICFHTSDSSWIYVKFIEFILHFSAFVFEIMWIMCVFCYLKQEETKNVNIPQNKLTWVEKQMAKVLPSKFGTSEDSSDISSNDDTSSISLKEPLNAKEVNDKPSGNPLNVSASDEMKLSSLKKSLEDENEDNNKPLVTDLPPEQKHEQSSSSSSEPLDKPITENVPNTTSLKEPPPKDKIQITDDVTVGNDNADDSPKIPEQSSSSNKSLDVSTTNNKSKPTSSNESLDASTTNNEHKPTSPEEPKKEEITALNNVPLENETISPSEEKSKTETTK